MLKYDVYYEKMLVNLKMKMKEIDHYLSKTRDGYVILNKKGDSICDFYLCTKSQESDSKINRRYLSLKNEKDVKLIQEYSKKTYFRKLRKAVEKEIDSISNFLNNYQPDLKYRIYEELGETRQKYVQPLFSTQKDKVDAWEREKWMPNLNYQDGLRYETDHGEKVRSKSELYIANQLNQNKFLCAYRYECPLYLPKHQITINPDFTIMSRLSGKLSYWEHFGMMDDPNYVEQFIQKVSLYDEEGIRIGDNLICTFESSKQPLNTNIVKNIISSLS